MWPGWHHSAEMGSESLGHVTGQTAKHLPLYTEAEEGGGMRAGGLTAAAALRTEVLSVCFVPQAHHPPNIPVKRWEDVRTIWKLERILTLSCLHRDPARELQYDCLQTAMQSCSLDSKLEVGLLCSMQNFLFLSTCINAGLFVWFFFALLAKGKKK